MSNFKIRVSKNAICLDFDSLTEQEKKILFSGVKFDPSTHDIYRFSVAPDFNFDPKGSKRTRERKDYSLADTVEVKVETPSEEIALIGIFPITTTVDDTPDKFEFPIIGGFGLKGIAKDRARRGKHKILAWKTDDLACWFFLKPFVASGQEYMMQAVCIAPKSLPLNQRFLRCDARVLHKGRELDAARARRIYLPPC